MAIERPFHLPKHDEKTNAFHCKDCNEDADDDRYLVVCFSFQFMVVAEFRTCPFRLDGFRESGTNPIGATSLYHVPILGRQPCQLAWISLSSLIWHTFHSPPLHPSLPAFPLPTTRTVNADKRYLRRGLFRTSASRTAQLIPRKNKQNFPKLQIIS